MNSVGYVISGVLLGTLLWVREAQKPVATSKYILAKLRAEQNARRQAWIERGAV